MPSRLTSIEEALERDLHNLDQTFGSLSSSFLSPIPDAHNNNNDSLDVDHSMADSIEIGRGLTHNLKRHNHQHRPVAADKPQKKQHKRQSSTSSDFKLPDMTGCSKFLSTPGGGLNNKTKVLRVPYDERDHAVLDALQALQAQIDQLEKDKDGAISQAQRLKDRIIAERQGKLSMEHKVDQLKANLTKATIEIEQLQHENKLLSDKLKAQDEWAGDNTSSISYQESQESNISTQSSSIFDAGHEKAKSTESKLLYLQQELDRLKLDTKRPESKRIFIDKRKENTQCNICNKSTCRLHERLKISKESKEDIVRVMKKLQEEFNQEKNKYQDELDVYQSGCINGKSSNWRMSSSERLEEMFRQIEAKADVICTLQHAQQFQNNNDDNDDEHDMKSQDTQSPSLVFGKHKWLSL